MIMKVLGFVFVYLFSTGVVARRGLRSHPLISRRATELSGCATEDVGLTLEGAEVSINNLGGMGPDFSSPNEVIKIENIGSYAGDDLDIVISVKAGSDYHGYISRNGLLCGINENGKPVATNKCENGNPYPFGQINLSFGEKTTLIFEIQNHADGSPVELPAFIFSVFDVDTGGPTKEIYVVKGWDTAQYDDDVEMDLSTDPADNPDYCDANEQCLYALSTHIGKGCDNPTSPMDLGEITCENNTVDQRLRSFQVVYKNLNSFEVILDYPSENTERTGGRNMVWAFNSEFSWTHCGSREPTGSPVPTGSPIEPTTSPVEPTGSPIEPTTSPVEPTGSPIEPTTSPVEPTGSPIEPTTAPVEPTGSPITPSSEPTEMDDLICPEDS